MADETLSRPYRMDVSLNVLNHLGINLYSNTPAVLSEAVANAWDADATQVWIKISHNAVSIEDNGVGMSQSDINQRFLMVGFKRREKLGLKTPAGRAPMGRKGIGKLSLFSIAKRIDVFTTNGSEVHALRMDLDRIKDAIEKEEAYYPDPIDYEPIRSATGTLLVLSEFRKGLHQTAPALRRRISRRFSVLGPEHKFQISVDDNPITIADRDYYHKTEYAWVFGERAYEFSTLLEPHAKKIVPVDISDLTKAPISGWIATSTNAQQLKDPDGHSINKLVVIMRGKLAQEDILDEIGESSVYANYIFGEVYDDVLDQDGDDDIATSSRQHLIEDDPRYMELRRTITAILKQVRREWNSFRADSGATVARMIPEVDQWFLQLPASQREAAKTLLGKIYRLPIESEVERRRIIKHSILAFESYRYAENLDALDKLDETQLEVLVPIFEEFNDIEATLYFQIIKERIAIIKALQEKVEESAKEKVIQEHVFEHLWLLDPAWERATDPEAYMEQRFTTEFGKIEADLTQEEKDARFDIKYRMAYSRHVIVELKRSNRKISFEDIFAQTRKYASAMEKLLRGTGKGEDPFEILVVLGQYPSGWSSDGSRQQLREVSQLKEQNTRIILYDELLQRAYRQYNAYLAKAKDAGRIYNLIRNLDRIDEDENMPTK